MDQATHNKIVSFIWGIADDVLRDLFKRGKYPDVILPMCVIRRMDAVLEPTKQAVLDTKQMLDEARITEQSAALRDAAGQAFYNTSKFTLRDLRSRGSQQQLLADFEDYLNGFSANVQDILDNFKFRNQLPTLSKADAIGTLINMFLDPEIDLSPAGIDNHAMGTVFEELVRKFNEENNEEAGEHWTPRDAVRLMANLVFLPIENDIRSGTYLLYDCACGTGGMLTVAEETLTAIAKRHNQQVTSLLYGQEINPETYAVCKADMILKGEGESAEHIVGGAEWSTLSHDAFPAREFDFMLANPPYGKSWKKDLEAMGGKEGMRDPRFKVMHEGEELSLVTRSSDGQMLFLANMASKMNSTSALGSRIAEVHNGSSLFTGDAGQGESNIRRWLIESDWLEAIIALPLNLFYNTGIATYIWVLSNRKPANRAGQVQLIVKNPGANRKQIGKVLQKLRMIANNHVGLIELAEDLDIETVTEIFIRVNSAGAELSQADFVMSKIAANETYGGNMLRKAIDYFCRLTVAPEFASVIEKNDTRFAASAFFPKMRWLKDVNDDIYDPSYTDMLRVAFTAEFGRGKLADLVALLSGRNFETRQYEAAIAEESFAKLKQGILQFISQTHFERITMILRSAGFVTSDLIGGQNAVNFAYILYLRGRAEKVPAHDLERLVRRWYAMSILSGRYTGSPETAFDVDIRQIEARGLMTYADSVIENELPASFWTGMLPQLMDTSSGQSPYLLAFKAAQVKLKDKGFLSRDITVHDLLMNRVDVHHVFPRNHLKKQGLARGRYNQIANFVLAQSEINIAIGDKAPEAYFKELLSQCAGGVKKYGGITDMDEMRHNLKANCIPESLLEGQIPTYDDFLEQRRKLMALKIKQWFEVL